MVTNYIKMGKIWCNNSDVAFSSKHEMTLFEILTRDIHTPLTPPPPTPPSPQRGPHNAHNVQLKHDIINIEWMIDYLLGPIFIWFST